MASEMAPKMKQKAMIQNFVLHKIYLLGLQKWFLLRSIRKLIAKSEMHRAWFLGFHGCFEQNGINYGLSNPYGADLTQKHAKCSAAASDLP